MLDSLFGNLPVVQKGLQGLTARQRVIAENVANADTPRYKRMELAYEERLRTAVHADEAAQGDLPMATTNTRHFELGPHGTSIDALRPEVHQVRDETYRNDGNNVDIEIEMAKLADTNVRFNTLATLSRQKFDGLKGLLREIR